MVVTISENFQKFNRVWHTFQPSRYRRESPDMGHHLPVILTNLPVKLPFSVPKHAFSEQNLVIIFNSPGIVLLLPVKISEISEISEISRFQLLRGWNVWYGVTGTCGTNLSKMCQILIILQEIGIET